MAQFNKIVKPLPDVFGHVYGPPPPTDTAGVLQDASLQSAIVKFIPSMHIS
jgi:hypothetical protein